MFNFASAEELVFESISDQLVENIYTKNNELDISFEDQIVLVCIGIIIVFIVGITILGMIFIARSFTSSLKL